MVIVDPGAVGPRNMSTSTDKNDLGASTAEPCAIIRIMRNISAGLGRGALGVRIRPPIEDELLDALLERFADEPLISVYPAIVGLVDGTEHGVGMVGRLARPALP